MSSYIAAMRAAEQATRNLREEVQRTGRSSDNDFQQSQESAARLERALARLAETERHSAEEQRRASEERQRSTEETRQQTEETQRNSDETQRNSDETQRNSQEQEENRRQTQQNRDERGRFTGDTKSGTLATLASTDALMSFGAAGAVAAAEMVAAGVAVAAFGLLAAPSIITVMSAQEDLAGSWESLTANQRVSAMQVQALSEDYKDLAKAYEPQSLALFNNTVSAAHGLLPKLAGVVNATETEFGELNSKITDFISGRIGDEFLTWAGQQAPQALGLLGDNFIVAGDTALDLVQDIAPLGIGMLQLTHGVLSLVNAVAGVSPLMAQFAISALLLRAPLLGLAGAAGGARTRMAAYAAANVGASKSARLLHGVMAAGPMLYVAAGAALVLFAVHVMNAKTETDKLVDSLKIQHRATGNNLAGYQTLRTELQSRYTVAVRAADEAHRKANATYQSSKDGTDNLRQSADRLRDTQNRLREEIAATDAKMRTINAASAQLGLRYGVTAEQARRMATAAGVDLSTALDGTGQITNKAKAKLDAYRQAVELANNPMMQLSLSLKDVGNQALTTKDRMTALTAAFDAHFNPSIAAYQATIQLREGFRSLGEQMVKAKGSMSGNSAASLQLQAAFAQQLITVRELYSATFAKTKSTQAASAAVNQFLPVMYAFAGSNRQARAQVDALARTTGFNVSQTLMSRQAFITLASSMTGSRVQAESLWRSYQRLTGATNAGSTAVDGYITRTRASANAARDATAKTHGAAAAQGAFNVKVRDALPVLYALAGRNAQARAEVDKLARSTGHSTGAANANRASFMRAAEAMRISKDRAAALWRELLKIKDRDAHVSVTAKGGWHAKQMQQWAGRYHGGPINASVPGASRNYDSVPAMLRVDEHVWTPEEVDAVGGHQAMYRLRAMAKAGHLQGYARGGRVSFSHDRRPTPEVVGDVTQPIFTGIFGMVAAIAKILATQYKSMMGGGSVVAAARSQIGLPYSWGGGGKGGPSRGIGRGAGTVGFDCSGLTEYAWWRGKRVSIGGVTYSQHPNSRAIGGPRPGALGFNSSLGHVVLASNKRGYVIEAPYTGARVREVRKSMPDWRWPKGAPGKAQGGPITDQDRRIGKRFLDARSGSVIVEAKNLQIAGDPGGMGIPGYASGGWVRGQSGHDKVLLRATAGEYMVNRHAARANPGLVEGLNSGRIGEAMVRPTIRASAGAMSGAGGGGFGRGGDVHVHLDLHNHAVIGSQMEVDTWLSTSMERLNRQGRLPT